MAEEPENLTLRLLRDIRAAQDAHSDELRSLKHQFEELYQVSTHTLGVASNAHLRSEVLESRVSGLNSRVERLEAER